MDEKTLQKEMAEFRNLVASHKAYIESNKSATPEAVDAVPEILFDPFDIRQDALGIVGEIEPCEEYPFGAVIKWLNPNLRNRNTSWAGWDLFQYGDPYTGENGELLAELIVAAPVRFNKPNELDSYVRRTDLILGRIDKRLFNVRQHNREARSDLRRVQTAKGPNKVYSKGVVIQGEGMTDSKRPANGGFKMLEEARLPAASAIEALDHKERSKEHAQSGGTFRTELLPSDGN